ncbi:MAG TPA: hypothetical protein VD757_02075, partial [Candidatus Nitrosocosmicus sp.]|nr:hypothetical protein [Candidatus Nitrosocosmicus sp.]
MDSRGNKVFRLIMRTMAMLVVGIMISTVFLANVDTYSWFASSASGSAKVTAANTEDIIDVLELLTEGKEHNSKAIKIKKSKDVVGSPLVYFSIEGEAANYILHINPIRLKENCCYIIPIVTDINLRQYAEMLCREDNITGTLKVKYMNEFINETCEISLSPEYLRDMLLHKIVNEGAKPENEKKPMMRSASFVESAETADEINAEQDTQSITVNAIAVLAKLVEWNVIDSVLEERILSDKVPFSSGLALTSNQDYLIEIIYPGLKQYIEALESYISKLEAELEERNAQLAGLDKELACLE